MPTNTIKKTGHMGRPRGRFFGPDMGTVLLSGFSLFPRSLYLSIRGQAIPLASGRVSVAQTRWLWNLPRERFFWPKKCQHCHGDVVMGTGLLTLPKVVNGCHGDGVVDTPQSCQGYGSMCLARRTTEPSPCPDVVMGTGLDVVMGTGLLTLPKVVKGTVQCA